MSTTAPQLSAAEQLAVCAGRLGRLTYAQHVHLQQGQLTASADQWGVTVTHVPRDLPFMEHGAYDDNPRQLLQWDRDRMRAMTTLADLPDDPEDLHHRAHVAVRMLREHQLSYVRVTYPERITLTAFRGDGVRITARRPVKGWVLTRMREQTLLFEPIRG